MKDQKHPTDYESEPKPAEVRETKKAFKAPHKNHPQKRHEEGKKLRPGSVQSNAERGVHAAMAADFRNRFLLSLVVTLIILALSPMFHFLVGAENVTPFFGYGYVLFGLGSIVFWYGAWPFHKGLFSELKSLKPEMMTFISIIMGSAYLYISSLVFLSGKMLFLELAVLIDILLLGRWIHITRKLRAR